MSTELATLAKRIRYLDWWACMADHIEPQRQFEREAAAIRAEASRLGRNARRLWELGRDVPKMHEPSAVPVASRWDIGWRWAGAYCWAHGVRLSESEAQTLADPHRPGVIDWARVDRLIEDAQSSARA